MRIKLVLSLVLVAACGSDHTTVGDDDGVDAAVNPADGDPLGGLPTGMDQWSALCGKHYGDMISAKFCAGSTPPSLTSLADLEALLGLTVTPGGTNVRVTLNAESTGLGMRMTNPITPRAFLMTPSNTGGGANPMYQVLSFMRGEPLVELVANDPAAQTLRFFLIRFHPSCEPSCGNADLQTASIESGWSTYTIYDDATIANTTLDCLNCHQPAGPTTKKLLRMQELQNPWGHWFYPERPETLQNVQDFQSAHGSESYAGIPAANVMPSRPAALMLLLQNNGFATQPNAFDTLAINNERAASGGNSTTWQSLYANAINGTAIPVPYLTNPFDRSVLGGNITAYQQVMAGTLARDQLPDVTGGYLDAALPEMSIRPAAGLDGHGILVHMCTMCHNSKLDPSLSRARFDVTKLAQMSRQEKDLAITRLQTSLADRHTMPPVRFHELAPAERQAAIDELMK